MCGCTVCVVVSSLGGSDEEMGGFLCTGGVNNSHPLMFTTNYQACFTNKLLVNTQQHGSIDSRTKKRSGEKCMP